MSYKPPIRAVILIRLTLVNGLLEDNSSYITVGQVSCYLFHHQSMFLVPEILSQSLRGLWCAFMAGRPESPTFFSRSQDYRGGDGNKKGHQISLLVNQMKGIPLTSRLLLLGSFSKTLACFHKPMALRENSTFFSSLGCLPYLTGMASFICWSVSTYVEMNGVCLWWVKPCSLCRSICGMLGWTPWIETCNFLAEAWNTSQWEVDTSLQCALSMRQPCSHNED